MHSKYLARTTMCIALLALFSGCGKREEMSAEARGPRSQAVAPAPAPAVSPAPAAENARAVAETETKAKSIASDTRGAAPPLGRAGVEAQLSSSAAAPSFTEGERKFIRTAKLHFRVKNVYQSALAIEDAVAGQSGFVIKNEIGSSVQRTQRRPIGDGKMLELAEYLVHGQLVVRVPSNKTQEFLRSIAGQVSFLDQRNFDARDAQFDLLRQQLDYRRNQETQEELGQASKDGGKLYQKAEVIASRNETKASRDQARIAQKEFEDQIAYSTIQLSIYQLPNIRETEIFDIDELFRQSRPAFADRLIVALGSGWGSLLDVFLQLVKGWPLFIVLAGGAIVMRRRWKRGAAG